MTVGAPDRWDYLTFDKGRVFIAHDTEVTVVDGQTGLTVGEITPIHVAHGIAIAPERGLGYAASGASNTVITFNLRSLKRVAATETGPEPDAIVYDPISHHVFTMNAQGQSTTIIDAAHYSPITTLPLGGEPEFALTDGAGHLFINISSTNELVRFDTRTNAITSRWPLAGCESPHGLAMDTATQRLFTSCSNGQLLVVDADKGKILATLPIGRGSDAVIFDAKRQRVYSSNGSGTLSVISTEGGAYKALGDFPTMLSARTMALDPDSGRIFLAAADMTINEAADPKDFRKRFQIAPGSLKLLFLDPASPSAP